MSDRAVSKRPADCTGDELRRFAAAVRQGFASANETLEGRIRRAEWLAFHDAGGGGALDAVAALKAPERSYREEVFEKADARVSPDDFELELGWVFVLPAHRGRGIAESLCRQLLARVPAARIFATTRTDNALMMRILRALGFVRVGRPYRRRGEELVVFLHSPAASVGSGGPAEVEPKGR